MVILVSDKMFETITARARVVAEEQFRRLTFDTPPENAELIRSRLVSWLAERYVDRIADLAQERTTP